MEKNPYYIKSDNTTPQKIEKLALKFSISWNLFDNYIEEIKNEMSGLNIISVKKEGDVNEFITQKEQDARDTFNNFYDFLASENILPTYDELMLDSEEEYDEEEDDEYEEDDF